MRLSVGVCVVSLLLSACGAPGANGQDGQDGSDGMNGSPGQNGKDGKDGAATLVRVEAEPAGMNCADGGLAVLAGQDDNGNGTLDDDEVETTKYVCDGADAANVGATLEGSFTIRNSLDLSFLASVEDITGDLFIEASGLSKIELPNLKKVGGSVELQGDNANLTKLSLPALATVGRDVRIRGAKDLPNLDDLGNALAIAGSLAIADNGALLSAGVKVSSVGADLVVENNAKLAELSAFVDLTQVGGTVRIQDNPALASLNGFAKLPVIGGSLVVMGNASLLTASGFAKLATVGGDLVIDGNAVLASVSGFDVLASVATDLVIGRAWSEHETRGNPSLATLPSFDTLATIGGTLEVSRNDKLGTFPTFAALNAVKGNLVVLGNPGLTKFAGLPKLVTVDGDLRLGDIDVENLGNDALVALPKLDLLATVGGSLSIAGNAAAQGSMSFPLLTSVGSLAIRKVGLAGVSFPSLTTCQGAAEFRSNSKLTTLGLTKVASLKGDLTVSQNTALTKLSLPELAGAVTQISVEENPALGEVSGFTKVTSMNALRLNGDSLALLPTFSALASVSASIHVRSNTPLQAIGFPVLQGTTNEVRFVLQQGSSGGLTTWPLSGIEGVPGTIQIEWVGGLSGACTSIANWYDTLKAVPYKGGYYDKDPTTCVAQWS